MKLSSRSRFTSSFSLSFLFSELFDAAALLSDVEDDDGDVDVDENDERPCLLRIMKRADTEGCANADSLA